jgi:hypothetical protein
MNEWKAVKGYEGLYEVSSDGDVRNCVTGDIRKPQINIANGYRQIRLYKQDGGKNFTIHRIVAEAFLGSSNLQVNHINGDKSDNSVKNLEWVTPSENIAHSLASGMARRDEQGRFAA